MCVCLQGKDVAIKYIHWNGDPTELRSLQHELTVLARLKVCAPAAARGAAAGHQALLRATHLPVQALATAAPAACTDAMITDVTTQNLLGQALAPRPLAQGPKHLPGLL